MGPGTSAAAAIPIDDRVDDDDEDDDNIKVLIDKGDDDNNDDAGAVANINAQGNVKVGASCTASATGGSGFSPFILIDLDESAVTKIKGQNHKKYLNNLRRDYYNKDKLWVKRLHLQLPQGPRSKCSVNDMMPYMLLECNNNRYMQQCIFSIAGIRNATEGRFSNEFKNIMEHAHCSEKFQSARGKHEKEFEFDYLFRCFFDTNNEAFPNEDNHQHGVMCSLAALHMAAALSHRRILLNDGTSLEYMFCSNCGYFTNNLATMNTHVWKHYKVGLFCAHSKCDFVMNHVESMLQHGSLWHGYGKRNKTTPMKS